MVSSALEDMPARPVPPLPEAKAPALSGKEVSLALDGFMGSSWLGGGGLGGHCRCPSGMFLSAGMHLRT
jgi:hypothetical protein